MVNDKGDAVNKTPLWEIKICIACTLPVCIEDDATLPKYICPRLIARAAKHEQINKK
jgi:hypothetical protein